MDPAYAKLYEIARERAVDVDSIPEDVITVINDFTEFYTSAKSKSLDLEGVSLHDGVLKHSLRNMLDDLEHWERDLIPVKMRIAEYMIEIDNKPVSKNNIYNTGFSNYYWPFWLHEYDVRYSGPSVENVTVTEKEADKRFKYPFIGRVCDASDFRAPKLHFLDEPSITSLQRLCKDYTPKRFRKEYITYIDGRIKAYTRLDGDPRKGQAARIEALMKLEKEIRV